MTEGCATAALQLDVSLPARDCSSLKAGTIGLHWFRKLMLELRFKDLGGAAIGCTIDSPK